MRKFLFILVVVVLCIFPNLASSQAVLRVLAIGDSIVEPRSVFIERLQNRLGANGFSVRAAGRRGWTSTAWRNHAAEWRSVCRGYDWVIISLGTNDKVRHIEPAITRNNIEYLSYLITNDITKVYVMVPPNEVIPAVGLTRDGLHMSGDGAEEYARRISLALTE